MDTKTLAGLAIGLLVGVGLVTAAVTYTPVSGEQALSANSNATIIVDGASELNLSQPFINDTAVRVETPSGNLTMVGSGNATATVAASDIEGSTTALTGINASAAALTINPDDKPAFTVGKEIESVTIHESIAFDDGNVDFSYAGPDNTESRVTLRGLPAGTEVVAADANSHALLDTATVDANGVLTLDALDNSAHDVVLQSADDNSAPTVGNATADPQGDAVRRWSNETLSVDIDDPDLPTDELDVTFYVDGTVVDTQTVTSAGTVSTDVSGLSEGAHTWHISVEDVFEATTTSDTFEWVVDHYDPVVDNATATPTGEAVVRHANRTLSINVTDGDFAKDGDNLTASFYLDGAQVGQDTLSANGTASYATGDLDDGVYEWYVVVNDSYGAAVSSATNSYTIDHYDPQLADISPSGSLDVEPSEISVNVSDRDFAVDGDSLTVNISLDGSQLDSQTISANGTVTTSIPDSGRVGGQHDISVSVKDDYGQTANALTTYRVPDELTVYNETAPTQRVNTTEATVRFFKDDTVVERSTTNGTISLTGLPVSSDMTVVIEADGYVTRASYIESIYEQQRLYALAKNQTRNQLVFNLDDQTGNFPAGDTSLRIQKAITRDHDGDNETETQFETVAGDTFGASGQIATELVGDGERYRLVVENDEGDRRELGSYTVTGDAAVPLTIGDVSFSSGSQEDGIAFGATINEKDGQRYVALNYHDFDEETSELTYRIVREGNTSKVLANATVSGPFGIYSTRQPLPDDAPEDVSYRVTYEAVRDGETATGRTFVGDIPPIAESLGIDPTVLEYLSYVAIAALTGLVVVYDDRLAALVAVISATALSMLGAVSIPPLGLAMGGGIAVLYNFGRVRA